MPINPPQRHSRWHSTRLLTGILLLLVLRSIPASGQSFTFIAIDESSTWVQGASWIDADGDGDLDLFAGYSDYGGVATFDPFLNRNKFFRNDGNDVFTEATPPGLADQTSFTGGQTWADVDNDGHIDVYIANKNAAYERFLSTTHVEGSALFRHTGDLATGFQRVVEGDISGDNRIGAFAAAWADYDNDGWVDLVATTPIPTAYPNDPVLANVLFHNNGDGTFTRDLSSPVVTGGADYYTIPTWSDFDLDGDMDLYITNGPIQNGVLSPDYFFVNQLTETGTASFVRNTDLAFAAAPRDSQQANWVDYDNDGDLDLFVTNFGGSPGAAPNSTSGMANDLYRNDGNGSWTKIEDGPQSTDQKVSLGQTWGDFDNDGDLDLYVTNLTTFNSIGGNDYYQNSGYPDYSFQRIALGSLTVSGKAGWSAPAGDYDNDGDLDLYVTWNSRTGGAARDFLYRNDLDSGASWIIISAEGTTSNRSAIGARIRVKASIDGRPTWQLREISSQNAATGQNSLRAHFGLADATVVDSLIIEWPSGLKETFEDVETRQILSLREGSGLSGTSSDLQPIESPGSSIQLKGNYPNPFASSTRIQYSTPLPGHVDLRIFDMLGRTVAVLTNQMKEPGHHEVNWDAGGLPRGTYVVRVQTPAALETRLIVKGQ